MTTIRYALSAGAMFVSLLAVPAVASDGLGGPSLEAGPFSSASSQVNVAKPCSEAKHPAKCRARRGGHVGGPARSGPGVNPGRIGDGGDINTGGGGGSGPAGING
ncbi:hypothetical protein AB0D67_06410 [Streptosporangium sp. NPDC048047]|uniref:hypothetical protein n=1 Tax=Streptosporangium sp. NPDC048047 TaxID=3155748 RepID=UPI0034256483